MTDPLAAHPAFEGWADPQSGMVSYIRTHRVAPVQQSFYDTNPSLSADEAWLWFYTALPPTEGRTLGALALDGEAPAPRHFPQAGFTEASSLVIDATTR